MNDETDIASLYTINDDGSGNLKVTFKDGLAGSWLALAEVHYFESQNKDGEAE